ncbi:hypothetical protein CDL12_28800 [Handroanthus impetiginosus]|uniref:Uncharacterized protein n=1 Tax=Handroanthus impetiginosus TaxID=429701 RepID=A0A2G9G068_9LAMI|nr:hypothetical protein CDL12_28800 [Handroanthus impetiginosus]
MWQDEYLIASRIVENIVEHTQIEFLESFESHSGQKKD